MKTDVLHIIQSYLGNGGLFNPEMMDHDKVRELILNCREEIQNLRQRVTTLETRVEWAGWEKEYLRSQIPENHEMGQ